mgnify:CR=1 FL=1
MLQTTIRKITGSDVITNIFYGLSGIALKGLGAPFLGWIAPILLMVGSGIHHYYKKKSTSYLDWAGIYAVFTTLFWFSIYSGEIANFLTALTVGIVVMTDVISEGSFRKEMLATIGTGLLVSLGVQQGISTAFDVAVVFSIAFIPWKIAEDIGWHTPRYKLYHGFWHILTSYGVLQTGKIVFDLTESLF